VIRPALVLLAASLGGCATYSVQPFFDEGAKQVVYVIRFAETGVNAAAPIAAAAIAASDVSAAVTSAAITAAKFAPK
jgi:hypothetical protein